MIPYAGKVRDRCGAVRFAAERPGRRRRLRHRGHRSRSHQSCKEKEIPLHTHWSPPVNEHCLSDPAAHFLFWHSPDEPQTDSDDRRFLVRKHDQRFAARHRAQRQSRSITAAGLRG
jgi:hypothetical protein